MRGRSYTPSPPPPPRDFGIEGIVPLVTTLARLALLVLLFPLKDVTQVAGKKDMIGGGGPTHAHPPTVAQGVAESQKILLHFLQLIVFFRQEDLKKSFKQFGPLKDIHLPRDRHTGFAFKSQIVLIDDLVETNNDRDTEGLAIEELGRTLKTGWVHRLETECSNTLQALASAARPCRGGAAWRQKTTGWVSISGRASAPQSSIRYVMDINASLERIEPQQRSTDSRVATMLLMRSRHQV
ncbi:hypothetical protein Bca4012_064479 [Brassica carinata]|uniref:RRM domain-containing protein n=1 Tax=Brassica carinata TaxID=52824 RepID=A0A8X7VMM5_BRACI|nr:hypothetical protein Bca52824_016965 [Brassica carinata]